MIPESLHSWLVGVVLVLPLLAAFLGLAPRLTAVTSGGLTVAGLAGLLASLAITPGQVFELSPFLLGVRVFLLTAACIGLIRAWVFA